jgi:hypothetical protein
MQTIAETQTFVRQAAELLSGSEHADLMVYLAGNPLAGDEIVGTGGVRKVRFAARGKGKSGGVRVIYYFYDCDVPLYALYIYAKSDQADLTAEQRKAVTAFAAAIKAAIKAARRAN